MATTTNNGWATPDDTAFVYQGAQAMRTLGQAIDTSTGAGLIAWIGFTPTISGGFTVGNGTFSNALYCKIGKTVHYQFVFTYGSTSSAGTLQFALPSAAPARVANSQNANAWCNAGGASYPLLARHNSTTTVSVSAINSAGTYAAGANITTTIPGTWATGNIIAVTGTYEAA